MPLKNPPFEDDITLMDTLHPELAAQLRFQASLIRLCSAPHMTESVRPEMVERLPSQPQAEAIEKMAVLVPVRVRARQDNA